MCVLRGKRVISGTRDGMREDLKLTQSLFVSLDLNNVEDAGAIAIAETLKVNTTLAFVKYVCVPVAQCSDISLCVV